MATRFHPRVNRLTILSLLAAGALLSLPGCHRGAARGRAPEARPASTDFALFPCRGASAEWSVKVHGRVVLDTRFIPRGTPDQDAARDAIRAQLNYAEAAFHYDARAKAKGSFYASPTAATFDHVVITRAPYGLALAIDRPEVNYRSTEYANRAIEAGATTAADPALTITYEAAIPVASCQIGDQPSAAAAPAVIDLPTDPYLAYWLVPSANRRPLKWGGATRSTNPCADDEMADLRAPAYYYYVWNPRRADQDADGKSFSCGAWLRPGTHFEPLATTWERTDSAEAGRAAGAPLAELAKSGKSGKPLRATVIYGSLRPWSVPFDSAPLARALADKPGRGLARAATDAVAELRRHASWDPAMGGVMSMLQRAPGVLEITSHRVVAGRRSLELRIEGRLARSHRPVSLRVFYGVTSEDSDGGGSHWATLGRAVADDDLVFYIGHAGLGQNLDAPKALRAAMIEPAALRRRDYRLFAVMSCRAYGTYYGQWAEAFKGTRTDLLMLATSENTHVIPLATLNFIDRTLAGESPDLLASLAPTLPSRSQLVWKRLR